jgi:hypothetical protein
MADRKATTPEDTTPECPPCACTDMEREYGHNHMCVYGPLRFLPITSGVGPGAGSTRLMVIGAMNTNHTRYHTLRAIRS